MISATEGTPDGPGRVTDGAGTGPADDSEAPAARSLIDEMLPSDQTGLGQLKSKNVHVGGKRTSMRLEPGMWTALEEIAAREGRTVSAVVTMIADAKHAEASLTGAVRAFIADYYRAAATEEGHRRAGHGGLGSTVPHGLRVLTSDAENKEPPRDD